MKAEEYYKKIESKWVNEYPSVESLDDVWKFYKECGYQDPQKTLMSILNEVSWKENKVLDFGCDNGLMLKFICDSVNDIQGFGIDINSKAIEKANERFPELQFQSFNGVTIPFEDKYFDLVFVCAVIKHIRYEDRKKVYNELKRVAHNVFFIEIDAKTEQEVPHQAWTFYHSHFEEEFKKHFHPLKVIHEAGDLLSLYDCR